MHSKLQPRYRRILTITAVTITAFLMWNSMARKPSNLSTSKYTSAKQKAVQRCFYGIDASPCIFDYEWDERRVKGQSPLLLPRLRDPFNGWNVLNEDEESLQENHNSDRKIAILYFNERKEYLEKMDRYYYDEVKAASSHPNLLVRMWGPGWPKYNAKLTAQQNIAQAFPNLPFDIIYTKTWHHNVTSDTAVVIHGTGDCHKLKCIHEKYYPTHADAITFRYAGEILEFGRPEQWKLREQRRVSKVFPELNETHQRSMEQPMPFFFHSPDCADEALMHPIRSSSRTRWWRSERWEDSRPTQIQLLGYTDSSWYPLRAKILHGIEKGFIQNAKVYEHVGYVLQPEKGKAKKISSLELGVFDPQDPAVEHHRKNQQSWAKTLATTQICVFDSSILRKAIRKYQESFMSGCVVAADIPLEMESVFKGVVIPLRADMEVEEINDVLQRYLKDKERLARMAMEAFRRARSLWTCRNKVDRLLEAAEMVVSGERGYWFPFEFRGTCRLFEEGGGAGGKHMTEWCRKHQI
ncbi:hypothetical protein BCR33DRAFT_767196 [Rhizoclosmatium globosum]|uniref:Uncharacterized protein n=1 Tax=Rhizoclosmatium globosum TaxID=329046 RepID=A0A1Y2C7P9_9FUNG|nr:hypothetical protein BCR33DRAFT_767196 [Rhizoclosmatium globosum]|eukprot:ORY42335.1 hypothetical protein BCR33DRAFT_767196 [Rhizoclosmatium globosum]